MLKCFQMLKASVHLQITLDMNTILQVYIINFLHTIPISAVPIKNAPDIYNTWHWHGGSYPGDSNGIKKSHFELYQQICPL